MRPRPVRRLVGLVVFLAVLGVLLTIGDRAAQHLAQRRIAVAVQHDAHLAQPPDVVVHGFPFLLQALRGRYQRIDVTADNLFDRAASVGAGSSLAVEFDGVHISPGTAISGHVDRVPVESAAGSATVSYADLAAQAGVAGLTLAPVAGRPDELRATEPLSVANLPGTATLTCAVSAQGQQLKLTATDLTLGAGGSSVALPATVAAALRQHASYSITVPGLPSGVVLAGVVADDSGVVVQVSGTNMVLRP